MSLNIALMASGRGSNVKAILEAIDEGRLDAQVQCLICNVEDAPVLALAESAGISTYCIPHYGKSREAHEAEILAVLKNYSLDYLVLAGYMRLMTPSFFQHFQGKDHYRIVNIHPSLLPAFPGAHGYEAAYDYGVKISGVTVHFVDEQMDHGPIILQSAFPRYDSDTLEVFKQRGLELEHQIYPKALQLLAENQVRVLRSPELKRPYVEVPSHVLC